MMCIHEMNSFPTTYKPSGSVEAGKGLQKAILGKMRAFWLALGQKMRW